MNYKLWVFVGLAVVIGIGAVVFESSHGETDAESIPVVSSKSASSAPSGHEWFSNITPEVAQKDQGKSQVYAVGADGKPLDLQGMTVGQYVKSLRDAASKGDSDAAFNIYSAETLCTKLPDYQTELANIPANSESTYADVLRSIVKESQRVCVDFNISPRERIDYLRAAARGGNVRALEMSAMEAPEGIDPFKPVDATDPRVIQWRKDTVDYLTQAAAKGSLYAMANLSLMYEQGDVVKPDIPLALTYQIAAMQLVHPNVDIPDNAPSIGKMTSQLTPDQIATARANASALIKSISK